MKKKTKITILVLACACLAASIPLLIFLAPDEIPALFDMREKITGHVTKWFLIFTSIMPLVFSSLALVFSKKPKLQFLFTTLFVVSLYENILLFVLALTGKKLGLGEISELPLSFMIFLPLSFVLLICSLKLKNVKYKSKLGLNFRCTRETEFIWVQTHIFARNTYGIMSIILCLVSIVFAFVRFPLIEFGVFVLAIFISTLIIYLNSKSMYKKYAEMKTRRDNLENKNKEKNT